MDNENISTHSMAWLRNLGLLPNAERLSLDAFRPRGKAEHVSLTILILTTAAFLAAWGYVQRGMLFDPMLQNDDVRQHVFAFHRYDSGALADDPMALDMLRLAPPLVRGLYWAITPVTGLHAAAKVVQGLAFVIILAAALMLAASPRNGPATACVLLVLVLRSDEYLLYIVGGHARSFGFPLCFLWLAGVMTGNQWARLVAACLSALCYMPGLAVILGAEGIYALRNGIRFKEAFFRHRFIRYGAMVVVSLGLLGIYGVTKREAGSLPSYRQAQENPAFGRNGRTVRVPLEPVAGALVTRSLTSAFRIEKSIVLGDLLTKASLGETPRFIILLVLVAAIAFLARLRLPPVLPSIIIATIVITATAQFAAFRLYIPQRYMLLGTGLSSLALGIYAFSLIGARRARPVLRNTVATISCLAIWLIAGGLSRQSRAITICGEQEKELFAFIRSLPQDAKFAGHPLDCDDIPFWTGRAAVANMETTLPWLDKLWQRRSKACRDMLAAIYTQDRAALLSFCDAYNVTHLIIRKGRYVAELQQRSVSFEPMTSFALRQLDGLKDPRRLVINQITSGSLVFNDPASRYAIVDVARLRRDWTATRRAPDL